MGKHITAHRGTDLRCKGWKQEGILRMLENNLENAEDPENLIIYGGTGKAARNWKCYETITETLKKLDLLEYVDDAKEMIKQLKGKKSKKA